MDNVTLLGEPSPPHPPGPAPPHPPPPSPPHPPGPAPHPHPPGPPSPAVNCNPSSSPPQMCPGGTPCPKCGKPSCPCPPHPSPAPSADESQPDIVLPAKGIKSMFTVTSKTASTTLATFSDGTPALIKTAVGRGSAYYAGFMPGLSYFVGAIPHRPVDRSSVDEVRWSIVHDVL